MRIQEGTSKRTSPLRLAAVPQAPRPLPVYLPTCLQIQFAINEMYDKHLNTGELKQTTAPPHPFLYRPLFPAKPRTISGRWTNNLPNGVCPCSNSLSQLSMHKHLTEHPNQTSAVGSGHQPLDSDRQHQSGVNNPQVIRHQTNSELYQRIPILSEIRQRHHRRHPVLRSDSAS